MSCHTASVDPERLEFKVLTWPPDSPDLDPMKHLWDVLLDIQDLKERIRCLPLGAPRVRAVLVTDTIFIVSSATIFQQNGR